MARHRSQTNQIIFVSEESEKSGAMIEYMNLYRHKYGVNGTEMSPSQIMELNPSEKNSKRCCYILDELEGPAFDHIVEVLKSRVVSPVACVMATKHNIKFHSIVGKVLASISMHNVTACCTDVDFSTRNKIRKLVELMGGRYGGDLNVQTTHLICNSVGSKKYIVATQMQIPILTPDWVYKAFEMRKRQIFATDDQFMSEFRVPILAGCSVCVSGLPLADRKLIERAVLDNGGKYSPDLKYQQTTHLIANEAATGQQKVAFALKWKIPVVTQRWLSDCLEKGYFCDPNLYKFDSSRVDVQSTSAVSAGLNESSLNAGESQKGRSSLLNTEELPCSLECSDILKFCKAHIMGLVKTDAQTIEELLKRCGATVYMSYQQGVTHVICEQLPPTDFLTRTNSDDICFIKPAWVVNCCQEKKLLPIDEYELKRPSDLQQPIESPMSIRAEAKRRSNTVVKPLSSSQTINSDPEAVKIVKRQTSCLADSGLGGLDEISKSYLNFNDITEAKLPEARLLALDTVVAHIHETISDAIRVKLTEAMKSMGASIAENLTANCTHLIVDDSKIEEKGQECKLCDEMKIVLVSSDWVESCEKEKCKVPEENYRPKLIPAVAQQWTRQAVSKVTTRNRSKNLKTLEPTPIPSEENASFSVMDHSNKGDDSQSNNFISTPSKLNFDLRGSLAKLKEGTPGSLSKIASAPTSTSSSRERPKLGSENAKAGINNDSNDSFSKLPINLLSKFQKSVDHYVECSQSVQIGWDAESNSYGNNNNNSISCVDNIEESGSSKGVADLTPKSVKKTRIFQITSIPREQRPYLENMIDNLGALFIPDSSSFDVSATHLVCKVPLKSEKYIASVAKGLWVLSCNYLEDSTKAGRFLNEEDYEWGSDKVGFATLQPKLHNVAKAAKRWRVLVGQQGIYAGGAYASWKVLFHTSKAKTKGLASILIAGGAEILHEQPPFCNIIGATHAFLEPSKVDMSLVNCSQLTANGIECFKSEYIADYLILENVDKQSYLVIDPPETTEPTPKRIKVF